MNEIQCRKVLHGTGNLGYHEQQCGRGNLSQCRGCCANLCVLIDIFSLEAACVYEYCSTS